MTKALNIETLCVVSLITFLWVIGLRQQSAPHWSSFTLRFNRSAFIMVVAALVAAPTFAADVSVGVGINLPGVAFPVPAPPPVYVPAPVYVAPPRPVYYGGPAYYEPDYHRRPHGREDWDDDHRHEHRGEWKHERHHDRGDRD